MTQFKENLVNEANWGRWRGHSQRQKAADRDRFDKMPDEELNKQIVSRTLSGHRTAQKAASDLEVHHLQPPGTYWDRVKRFHESTEYDVESMLEYIEGLDEGLKHQIAAGVLAMGLLGGAHHVANKDDVINPQTGVEHNLTTKKPPNGAAVQTQTINGVKHNFWSEPSDKAGRNNDKRHVYSIGDSFEEFGNPIIEMIDNLISGSLTESNALFYDLIQYKINEKIELKKLDVAAGIFGESKDEDEDDDNKSAPITDEEEAKNTALRLGKIKSAHDNKLKPYDPSKSRDDNESENPNDKRVQNGLSARINANKKTGEDELTTLHHKNGEKSNLSKEDSDLLFHTLSGKGNATIHKKYREQLLGAVSKSKEGLEKTKEFLKKLDPDNKQHKQYFDSSIYTEETQQVNEIFGFGSSVVGKPKLVDKNEETGEHTYETSHILNGKKHTVRTTVKPAYADATHVYPTHINGEEHDPDDSITFDPSGNKVQLKQNKDKDKLYNDHHKAIKRMAEKNAIAWGKKQTPEKVNQAFGRPSDIGRVM